MRISNENSMMKAKRSHAVIIDYVNYSLGGIKMKVAVIGAGTIRIDDSAGYGVYLNTAWCHFLCKGFCEGIYTAF